MVGAIPGSSDTIGGPVAGVGFFDKFVCAVDVVVGPVGGDRVYGLVDGSPWFKTSSGGVFGVGGRWKGWKNLSWAGNVG